MKDLGQLFREARLYGLVSLFSSDTGNYSCTITFNSIEHTELKAKSGFNNVTPEQALCNAILSAKKIVGEVDKIKERILLEGTE